MNHQGRGETAAESMLETIEDLCANRSQGIGMVRASTGDPKSKDRNTDAAVGLSTLVCPNEAKQRRPRSTPTDVHLVGPHRCRWEPCLNKQRRRRKAEEIRVHGSENFAI
jgi:hypothetical protein